MAKKGDKQPAGIRNKKASHKYEILEKFECGIVLRGTEVKSLRAGSATLEESHARIQGHEIFLVGFNIPPYKHGNVMNHEPTRTRKLLLHKREIAKLLPKVLQRGQTLVPSASTSTIAACARSRSRWPGEKPTATNARTSRKKNKSARWIAPSAGGRTFYRKISRSRYGGILPINRSDACGQPDRHIGERKVMTA
jgi:SsrA-binding protein